MVVVMLTTSLSPQNAERAESHEIIKAYLNKPLTVDMVKNVLSMLNELGARQIAPQ